MRKKCNLMNIFSLVILVITCFFSGCETLRTVDVTEKVYSPGTWDANKFSSEWFGFRYSPTSDMILRSEVALKDFNAKQSVIFDGVNAEQIDYAKMQIVYEVIGESTDGVTTVEILSEKLAEENFDEKEYSNRLRLELIESHGRDITFLEERTRKLGNIEYLELTGEIKYIDSTRYQTFLLKKIGDRIATVIVYYQSPETLNRVLRSFSSPL